MNSCPLFTLVRASLLQDSRLQDASGDFDYPAGSAAIKHHDAIPLVDPDGLACAIPVDQQYQQLDDRFEFPDGSLRWAPRLLRHNPSFMVDYIDSATRNRLLQIMHDRERVLLNPGFGAQTELAWRGSNDYTAAAARTDETGRWTLNATSDNAGRNYYWQQILRGVSTMDVGAYASGYPRWIDTPWGRGLVAEPSWNNLANPDHPTGVAAHGWTAAGAGAGTLSFTYDATGFGWNQAPGALRVVGSSSTAERYLTADFLTWTGSPITGNFWFGVFLRGDLGPAGAVRIRYNDGATEYINDTEATDVGGGWRLFYVQARGTASTQGAIEIVCGGVGLAHSVDFEVGPRLFCANVGFAGGLMAGFPNWQPQGLARIPDVLYAPSFKLPRNGSLVSQFFVPAWLESYWRDGALWQSMINHYFVSGNILSSYLLMDGGSLGQTFGVYRSGSAGISADVYGTPAAIRWGRPNVAGMTWRGNRLALFVNAVKIAETANPQIAWTTANGNFYVAGDPIAPQGSWPIIPLSLRVEKESWTDDRMGDIQRALLDDAALSLILAAQGRQYYITRVPSTPRPVAGASDWIGQLDLEQADIDTVRDDSMMSEFST